MKNKIQVVLSFIVLVFALLAHIGYLNITESHMRNELAKQVVDDNRALGAKLIDFMLQDWRFETLSREEKEKHLMRMCNSVDLPNGGFVCAVSPEGELVAIKGGLSTPRINFEVMDLSGLQGNDAFKYTKLSTSASFTGLFYNNMKNRIDVISVHPVADTGYRLMVHQDIEKMAEHVEDVLAPIRIPGFIVAFLAAFFTFAVSHLVIRRYENKLERINKDLSKSNEMLNQVSTERRELLHLLTHDLKNPLGAIESLVELAKMDPDEIAESLNDIQKSAGQSLQIIDMVRATQAVESGKMSLELKDCNLLELVKESRNILKSKWKAKDVNIRMDIPDQLEVSVEPSSFVNSILNNLLSNAVKFSERGSSIEISARREGNRVLLNVRDYGVGMPETLRENIFSMSKATSRKGTDGEQGTGFGMPLVKKLLEAVGGRVRVTSKEGSADDPERGTCFELTLLPKSEP